MPPPRPRPPTHEKSPPSPHGLYDLQDILDKLVPFFLQLKQLSDVVPLRNGFIVSAHRLINIITLLTLVQAIL